MTGPEWGPASGGRPKQLVVLCHGVGSSGDDLITLAPVLSSALPDALFLAPHGPEPWEFGQGGRQWFAIGAIDPLAMGPGVRRATAALDEYLEAKLAAHGLPPEACALAGFSQGAMTVLFWGLRRAAAPRAIAAYAGALIEPARLPEEIKNRAPVLLVHGELDVIVPASRSREAAQVLRGLDVPVETLFIQDLPHNIDQAGLTAGLVFLVKSFG